MTVEGHSPRDGVDGWGLREYNFHTADCRATFIYERMLKGAVVEREIVNRPVELRVAMPRRRRVAA
jgi:hypothetical protein